MTGHARCLQRSMIHFFGRKRRSAGVTQGAFVTWHASRRQGGDVVRRLDRNVGICTTMTILAGTRCHASVVVGSRQPCGVTVMASIACGGGW